MEDKDEIPYTVVERSALPNTITARSALLDFYGNRAVSHASLFIASIFGLVTVLAIAQALDYVSLAKLDQVLPVELYLISIVPYGVFAYVGHRTFNRFKFYARMADEIQNSIARFAKPEEIKFDVFISGKRTPTNLDKESSRVAGKESSSIFRRCVIDNFSIYYLVLIYTLGISVYIPAFVRLLTVLI